jgi:hypothetical protein
MKSIIQIALFTLLAGCAPTIARALAIESSSTSHFEKKDIIGSATYLFTETNRNGVCTQAWFINDVLVDAHAYEEALLDALKEAQRASMHAAEKRRVQDQEMREKSTCAIHKKMLALAIDEVELWIQKLHTHQLCSFLAFNPATIATQDALDEVTDRILPAAKQLLTAPDTSITTHDMQHIAAHMTPLPDRLSMLYRDSLNNAISCCNDTKTLKDLLEIASHA